MKIKLFFLLIMGILSFPIFSQCLDGDCVNDIGALKTESFVYNGYFEKGKIKGLGCKDWNNGYREVGIWENGKLVSGEKYKTKCIEGNCGGYPQGEGTQIRIYENNKTSTIKGTFRLGNPEYGEYKGFDGTIFKGSFNNYGQFNNGEYKKNDLIYKGQFYNNKFSSNFKDGEKCIEGDCINRGTILYSNGDTFSGTFLGLGVKSEGKYKWVNGDSYVGTFNKRQFVYGELKVGDMTYSGSFLNDKYNGKGKLVTDDATYEGGFKEGKFYGYGELYVNMYKATIKGDWNGSYMVGKVYAKDYVSPKIIYENGEFKSFNNSSKVNELATILLEFIKSDNISSSSYTTSYSYGNSANGQSKIYNGNYYGKKDVIGYFETGKIYDGNYYGKKDIIGYIEDGKIYSGNYYGKKDVVGYYENGKIYNGNYYGKKDVIGYYEDGKIYTGNYYGKKDIVGYYENGGATAAAAAFLLLL